MITRLLDRLFAKRVIVNCERQAYLHRWFVIRTERFALFIHKFVRSDEDRALHDHPWSFLVVPIWRGYVEHSDREEVTFEPDGTQLRKVTLLRPSKRRVWPILGARFRRAEYRHRVELIDGKPSWSLFFRFRSRRTWGFWPTSGFIAWNKWWEEKCE